MLDSSPAPEPLPPPAPALVAGVRGAAWLEPTGEIETLKASEAASRIESGRAPIVCHARATAVRLGLESIVAFDVLELFAFVRPARFALPTVKGLTQALDLALPTTMEREAESLIRISQTLLGDLAAFDPTANAHARAVAWVMARAGWAWGPAVLAALGAADWTPKSSGGDAFRIWQRLPEWQDHAPVPPPGNKPVSPDEARVRLQELVGPGAEKRPQQADYAAAAAAAFRPAEEAGHPSVVLAEAGTGVGKTLGYIAPASLWAEKNEGTVWISTFTRNLQRQLDAELDRLYPDPDEKAARVVVRKGRENYFCLLNYEEAVGRMMSGVGRGIGRGPADGVQLGLIARWAAATRDGDMVGGDFPSWLAGLMGPRLTLDLTDTRGECIYSACTHYGRCFIERSARRARRARIVVANHALVLVHAARGGDAGADGQGAPTRYVFDEGHHVFAAADAAFSAHLSGRETADLRRWLLGAEETGRGRSRGLEARLGEIVVGDEPAKEALAAVLAAARALPGPGWRQRIAGGAAVGAAESFLARVRQQVYARDGDEGTGYDIEAEPHPPVDGLIEAASGLDAALARLIAPVKILMGRLAAILNAEAGELETSQRVRIEAAMRSLERRALDPAEAWRAMLAALGKETPPAYVDWMAVERDRGQDADVGLYRHWVDPTIPFAETVVKPAHGVVITSATLRDQVPDGEDGDGWARAAERTGLLHLDDPPMVAGVASPFDYPNRTRVFVVGDVRRDDPDQVAAAYRELFLAAGGGGLGLFTAIARLRQVHQRIAKPLDEAGIPLLAQHIDALDTGTLVDIFRAEENACLLGTDAVRDGVDVPGRSLRLIVFDRVPWPRPDILHRARRAHFGGKIYDEMLTRLKLKQAFGRLIRRADDKGVFVMLDRAMPTRLLGAFPPGVPVERVGLKQATAAIAGFLAD